MGKPVASFVGALNGVHIWVVDPGTVISSERNGARNVVTDEEAICKGTVMWMTPSMWDHVRLKTAPSADYQPPEKLHG